MTRGYDLWKTGGSHPMLTACVDGGDHDPAECYAGHCDVPGCSRPLVKDSCYLAHELASLGRKHTVMDFQRICADCGRGVCAHCALQGHGLDEVCECSTEDK